MKRKSEPKEIDGLGKGGGSLTVGKATGGFGKIPPLPGGKGKKKR